MAWESCGPEAQGFISHLLINTELSVIKTGESYTVMDGASPYGNFQTLEEAKAAAEDVETLWCIEHYNTEWVNPNTGRTVETWRKK